MSAPKSRKNGNTSRSPRRRPTPVLTDTLDYLRDVPEALRKTGFVMLPAKMSGLGGKGKLSGPMQYTALELIAGATLFVPPESEMPESGPPFPEYGAVTANRLAKASGCSITEAESILDDTCDRGLAERIRDPEDPERWLYKLTPERWEQTRPYRLAKKGASSL